MGAISSEPAILGLAALIVVFQPLIIWYLSGARKSAAERGAKLDSIYDHLATINGRLGKHDEWMSGHTKHTDDQNDRLHGLESRERRRWEFEANRK